MHTTPRSTTPIDAVDIFAEHLARVPIHRAIIRTLEQRLLAEQPVEHPVLDIGCGDGHFAAVAYPNGIDAGIDITDRIVSEAYANGTYRSLAVASATALPYRNAAFPTIISNCVIEHIVDIDAVIAEVSRVLLPQGVFMFSVPNNHFTEMLFTVRWLQRLGLRFLARRYGEWWNGHAAHRHLDSPETWKRRLAAHGLAIEHTEPYMSQEATCAFELSHYYGIPSIIWHKLSGRWSTNSEIIRSRLAYRIFGDHAAEPEPAIGSCTFYVARKEAEA